MWEKLQDKPVPPAPQAQEDERPVAESSTDQTVIAKGAGISAPAPQVQSARAEKHAVSARSLPRSFWFVLPGAVVAAALAWWTMHRSPVVDAAALVRDDIAAAERELAQGNYLDPPESSAVHYFAAALQIDPSNAEARRGMDAVADRLVDGVKDAIIDRDLLRAQSLLESVRRIRPKHRQLALLDLQLEKTRDAERKLLLAQIEQAAEPDRNVAQAPPAVEEHAPKAVNPTSPSGIGDRPPHVRMKAITAQLDRGESAAAPSAITVARAQGAPEGTPESAGQMLANAQTTREPVVAPVPAISAAPPEPPIQPALIKYVPAEYPIEARRSDAEGWIKVRLAVNASGDVVDAHVEDGERRDLFARAALAAVRQWQYTPAPKTIGGLERLVTVRLEFKLKT